MLPAAGEASGGPWQAAAAGYPRISALRSRRSTVEVPIRAAEDRRVPTDARFDPGRKTLRGAWLVRLAAEPGDVSAGSQADAGSLREDGFHRHGRYHHERHSLVLGCDPARGIVSRALRPAECGRQPGIRAPAGDRTAGRGKIRSVDLQAVGGSSGHQRLLPVQG